jgi:hypothetical protein
MEYVSVQWVILGKGLRYRNFLFIFEYLFNLMMTVCILKEDIPEEVAALWA